MRHTWLGPAVALAIATTSERARAVDPFEIQVYEGDINQPREIGMELHTNFVASGRSAPAFMDEAVPHHTLRMTLEPSYGVLSWWELGLYLQFATAPSRSEANFGGFKLRSKFILPRAVDAHLTLGLNIEVGRGAAALGSAEWSNEFRPIIAYERGRWMVALNPLFGWTFSGAGKRAVPHVDPAGKFRFDTHLGFGVGLEYYSGLGDVDQIGGLHSQEHFVYLAGDLVDGPVELNVAIGRGLTGASDDWTIKTIVGKEF